MIIGQISKPETVAMTAAEFGNMFVTWRPRFETIARRYVRDAAIAEDIVSDSFMAFWENRNRISVDVNLYAYILTIIRNKCLDWLRAQSLHTKIEQEIHNLRQRALAADIRSLQALNPDEMFSKEIGAIVEQSLEQLPELTRNVFVVRRFNEMSYTDIAKKYAITERRVEFELEKAMKQLRAALKDYLSLLFILL